MMTLEQCLIAAANETGSQQRAPIFKRKRANGELTREQVKAIKRGRKLLRKELKAKGLKSKQDFELTATSMGLYFDNGFAVVLPLLLRWLPWLLLGALLLSMGVMSLVSAVTELRGHFTISLDDAMFKEGFVLSETSDFRNATTYLFATPVEDVPCISITDLPDDLADREGNHSGEYFAYSFYLRNEGDSTVDYHWELALNSESRSLSDAAWVMLFQDGKMVFYAEPDEYNRTEALPAFDDNTRGYLNPDVLMGMAAEPEEQFQLITQRGEMRYYRLVPRNFLTESLVTQGDRVEMEPMEVHKFTVVIWLEGDDPDCNNDLIGGHVGMEFNFKLTQVHGEEETTIP